MSGARGTVRKVYDFIPQALTSNGDYDGVSGGGTTTSWSSGLATAWITQISQSVNDNGRVGISIAAESLDVRIKITPDPTVIGYQQLRIIIVADNECDGNTPGFIELLGDTAGSATSISTGLQMSFLQPAYFGRFKVLEDRNWLFQCNATSTANHNIIGNQDSFFHESHHDLKGHRIMWDTTDSSAISNARKGHIFAFYLYSNQVTSAGGLPSNGADPGVTGLTIANPPCIQQTYRLRFRDE